MTVRRILAATIAATVMSIGLIATPASAAPRTYTLPKACQASMGSTASASDFSRWGVTVKPADLHPRSGTEYAYVLNCTDGRSKKPRPVVVIASASGKALAADVLTGADHAELKSVSTSGGIKIRVFDQYKKVSYDRPYVIKWNAKAKNTVVTKEAIPGYVKATHSLSAQMKANAKITAVTGSKANLSKLKAHGKKFAAAKQQNVYCDYVSKTKGKCAVVFYKGNKGHYALFNLTKSGSKYKATSVRVVVADAFGG